MFNQQNSEYHKFSVVCKHWLQLEEGSTATDYETYSSQVITAVNATSGSFTITVKSVVTHFSAKTSTVVFSVETSPKSQVAINQEKIAELETSTEEGFSSIEGNLGTLSFAKGTDGKWGYKVAGADPVIPFKSYEGYTLPTLYLLASYTSFSSITSSQVSIPLIEAKGISLTYVLGSYNDINATLVDNNGNTTTAFSHTGRGGYSGSYTNNSLDKNYKWLSISVSINGQSTDAATVSNIHVTT